MSNKRNKDDSDNKKEDRVEEDPYASLPPLKRPRKTVYKSSLEKRNREKQRRDIFNEGLQELAEIVFSVEPSIASGRNNATTIHNATITTVTNQRELMQTAVEAMRRIVQENIEQKKAIAELKKSTELEKTKVNLLIKKIESMGGFNSSGGGTSATAFLPGVHHNVGIIPQIRNNTLLPTTAATTIAGIPNTNNSIDDYLSMAAPQQIPGPNANNSLSMATRIQQQIQLLENQNQAIARLNAIMNPLGNSSITSPPIIQSNNNVLLGQRLSNNSNNNIDFLSKRKEK